MSQAAVDYRELVLRWAPIPETAQEHFFDDDQLEAKLLFTGGRGSGKTSTLCAKVLKLSAINAPLPGIWLVPSWDHIEKTILPALTDVDPATGEPWFLTTEQYDYHQTHHVFSWIGGGPIWFFTAENFKGIAGPNVAYLAVDEPGSIDERAWRNAIARVRHPNATLRQIVASGTPEGLNWLYEWFGDAGRTDKNRVYRMRTTENTELLKHHPDFIAQIKENATEAELQSYLDGQFTNLTGAIAHPQFNEDTHWLPGVPIEPNLPLRLTFDFNVNPMTLGVCQIGQGPKGRDLRVIDWVSEHGGATVESCCQRLIERYPQGWSSGAVVYGDATGKARHVKSLKSNYEIIANTLAPWMPSDATREERRGFLTFKVPSVNPAVSERINAVNRLLLDSTGCTRLWIRKTEPARMCATRELVRSLQRTSKKTGTDDIEKKAGETHTHAGEALGYLIAKEFPVLKPVISVGSTRWGLD